MIEAAKILIVEDEYITAKTIAIFLEESGYNVVGKAMNAQEAIDILSEENENIDCVILDINIDGDKDGIWIANYIKDNYSIPYIYLTAYTDKETINRAVKSSPYGFLAKPFQKVELFSAIEIALHKHNEQLTIKGQEDNGELSYNDHQLFLRNVDKFEKVAVSEINFIESQKNYISIHTNNTIYKQRSTIGEFLEQLPQNDFIKTHRAFIVNIHKVKEVDKSNNSVLLENASIPLSRAYKKDFLTRINLI